MKRKQKGRRKTHKTLEEPGMKRWGFKKKLFWHFCVALTIISIKKKNPPEQIAFLFTDLQTFQLKVFADSMKCKLN